MLINTRIYINRGFILDKLFFSSEDIIDIYARYAATNSTEITFGKRQNTAKAEEHPNRMMLNMLFFLVHKISDTTVKDRNKKDNVPGLNSIKVPYPIRISASEKDNMGFCFFHPPLLKYTTNGMDIAPILQIHSKMR